MQGRWAHLFLDLEFRTPFNPDKDPDRMVDTVLAVIDEMCTDQFGIGIMMDKVVEMDATYPGKCTSAIAHPFCIQVQEDSMTSLN